MYPSVLSSQPSPVLSTSAAQKILWKAEKKQKKCSNDSSCSLHSLRAYSRCKPHYRSRAIRATRWESYFLLYSGIVRSLSNYRNCLSTFAIHQFRARQRFSFSSAFTVARDLLSWQHTICSTLLLSRHRRSFNFSKFFHVQESSVTLNLLASLVRASLHRHRFPIFPLPTSTPGDV